MKGWNSPILSEYSSTWIFLYMQILNLSMQTNPETWKSWNATVKDSEIHELAMLVELAFVGGKRSFFFGDKKVRGHILYCTPEDQGNTNSMYQKMTLYTIQYIWHTVILRSITPRSLPKHNSLWHVICMINTRREQKIIMLPMSPESEPLQKKH